MINMTLYLQQGTKKTEVAMMIRLSLTLETIFLLILLSKKNYFILDLNKKLKIKITD